MDGFPTIFPGVMGSHPVYNDKGQRSIPKFSREEEGAVIEEGNNKEEKTMGKGRKTRISPMTLRVYWRILGGWVES